MNRLSIALSLFLLLAGNATGSQDERGKEPGKNSRYVSQRYGVSFQPPRAWGRVDTGPDGVKYESPDGSATISLESEDLSTDSSIHSIADVLDDLADTFFSRLRQANVLGELRESARHRLYLGGATALQVEASGVQRGVRFRTHVTLVPAETQRRLFLFFFICPAEQFDDWAKVASGSLASIEVNGQPANNGPALIAKKVDAVDISYDRFEDQTTISTKDIRLYGSNLDGVTMKLLSLSQGEGVRKPAFVGISLHSIRREPGSYWGDRHLILIVDGKRLDIGYCDVSRQYESGYTLESCVTTASFDVVLRIASARVIEGKVGLREFVLDEPKLAIIRALVLSFDPTVKF